MAVDLSNSVRSYSPPISGELQLDGERFTIDSIGPTEVILREARSAKPGCATVRISVDGVVRTRRVNLPAGIDPNRLAQPLEILKSSDEATA